MTPQERELVSGLFDRLSKLEGTPRDPAAESAIADGLRRAPNALYALVQTVLVQDEALRRADAQIRELRGDSEPEQGGGFLDSMRRAFAPSQTSVPTVRPGDSRWGNSAQQNMAPAGQPAFGQAPAGSGGSFLGTAAASAAGVIGGALLYQSIGSMFGGGRSGQGSAGQAFAGEQGNDRSPWGDASNSDLAREAGLDNIGRGGDSAQHAGLFDDNRGGDSFFDGGDFGNGDFDGGDFGGDSEA